MGAPMKYGPIFVLLCTALSEARAQQLTTLIDNGEPNNRVDIVFLSEGYTQQELDDGLFDDQVNSVLDFQFLRNPEQYSSTARHWPDPFPRYAKFFNAHKIEIASAVSLRTLPPQSNPTNTAMGSHFPPRSETRYFARFSPDQAQAVRYAGLTGTGIFSDLNYVAMNSEIRGGSAYWGKGGFAGFSGTSNELTLHEAGHSFAGLADEYEENEGVPPGGEGQFNGRPNITTYPTGAKWSHWIGYEDPRDSHLDIGVYEGGPITPRVSTGPPC